MDWKMLGILGALVVGEAVMIVLGGGWRWFAVGTICGAAALMVAMVLAAESE